MTSTTEVAFRSAGLSKTFGHTAALQDFDIEVLKGERLAVLGENGAGKSTLMKLLAGVYPPTAGTMELLGKPYAPASPRAALDAGVSIVYQEPSGFPDLTVLENLWVGQYPRKDRLQIDWSKAKQAGAELFERLDLNPDWLDQDMRTLSLGEQQMVLIARAADASPTVLILDEPTSILTAGESEKLFEIVRSVTAAGTSVLYVTHRLAELREVADDVVVLRDGRQTARFERRQWDEDGLVTAMSGREIQQTASRNRTFDGEPVLQTTDFEVDTAVRGASVSLMEGEILGLYGLVGSGRTEWAMGVIGALPRRAGELRVRGEVASFSGPREAQDAGIAYLPEDRRTQAIFPHLSVATNLSAIIVRRLLNRFGFRERAAEDEFVTTAVERLSIKTSNPAELITNLSGGHQQKTIFARVNGDDPSILLLDEPTRGIDVATKSEIHRLMMELADDGKSIVIISSELMELIGLVDRILVFRDGQVAAELTGDEINEETIIRSTLGVG